MKLSEAIAYFDQARTGEVSDATRRWFYYTTPEGKKGGRLWSLVQSLGDLEVKEITIHDLRRWRSELLARESRWEDSDVRPSVKGGLSQDGFRNYIRAARQFFKWLYDEGIIDENTARRLPVPPTNTEEPKAIDTDNADKILAIAHVFALRDYAYHRLKEAVGAKIGELDRLRTDDLDLPDCSVTIHRYTRYRYTPRLKEYGRKTGKALADWCQVRNEITADDEIELVFTGRGGEFPTPMKGKLIFGVRNEAMIQTLASSACRAGGLASMKTDRVNLDNGTAVVWEKGDGGFLQSRRILLDDDACRCLDLWLSVHPGGEALFPGIRGPMTRDGVYQVVTALAREAGVEAYTNPHAWRHTWSIEALRRGADINTVARVLGNSPETVMKSYARWASKEIQERHQRFNWKNNGDGTEEDEKD